MLGVVGQGGARPILGAPGPSTPVPSPAQVVATCHTANDTWGYTDTYDSADHEMWVYEGNDNNTAPSEFVGLRMYSNLCNTTTGSVPFPGQPPIGYNPAKN
jgi:hypothetical protein